MGTHVDVTVRAARLDDLQSLVEFNQRLAGESEGTALDPAVLRAGVAAVLAEPSRGRYFIAEAAGRVVGQTCVTYEWSDWRNGTIWWLQSVYVHTDFRRSGVFRRLLQQVVHEAGALDDVVGLRLYVAQDNRTAQETYRRLGFDDAGYVVMERLGRLS